MESNLKTDCGDGLWIGEGLLVLLCTPFSLFYHVGSLLMSYLFVEIYTECQFNRKEEEVQFYFPVAPRCFILTLKIPYAIDSLN
jgi:hypothetical protein